MRRRCGLLAVAGWLLMSPPLVQDAKAPGGYRLDLSADPYDWNQVSAHDTAADCERARSEATLRALDLAREKKKEAGEGTVVDAARSFRCVPAEYVYPPALEEDSASGRPVGTSLN